MSTEVPDSDAHALPGITIAGFRVLPPIGFDPDGIRMFSVIDGQNGEHLTMQLAPADNADASSRFLRNARLLASLTHPGLAEVRTVGEARRGAYIVTEELRGPLLASALDGELSPMHVIRILGQVADALDTAHAVGLLHRQVRPGSVALEGRTGEGSLLVNFALGRSLGPIDPGSAGAQEPYVSPEELRGEAIGPPADRYALACTLFECLTGTPPFGDSGPGAARGHLHAPPPRVTAARSDLAPALDDVLQRGLAKHPAERHSSAADLVSDAARALFTQASASGSSESLSEQQRSAGGGAGMAMARTTSRSPEARSGPGSRRNRRRRIGRAAAGLAISLAVIALAAAGGLLLSRLLNEEKPLPRKAIAGPLTLEVPGDWARSESAPRIGELDLEQAMAIGPASDDGLVIGIATDRRAVLNPLRVAGEVQRSPPRPVLVRLGSLEAYRWQGLRTRIPERYVNLFVAPTSAGAVTVACYSAGAIPAACARAAGSARLTGARGYSPMRGAQWRRRLGITIRRLSGRRRTLLVRLKKSGSARGQARNATALARAHGAAVRELSEGSVPPQAVAANRRVVASLRRLDRAYRRLGAAARRGRRNGYARAARTIRRADSGLRRTLRSI